MPAILMPPPFDAPAASPCALPPGSAAALPALLKFRGQPRQAPLRRLPSPHIRICCSLRVPQDLPLSFVHLFSAT